MKKLIAALLVASTLTGCYSLTYTSGYQPDGAAVTFSRDPEAKVVNHFRAEHRAVWLAGGLLGLSQPDVQGMIRREAMGHKVQALSIHSEQSFVDGLITVGAGVAGLLLIQALTAPQGAAAVPQFPYYTLLLALLIPQTRTVTVEGDVLAK